MPAAKEKWYEGKWAYFVSGFICGGIILGSYAAYRVGKRCSEVLNQVSGTCVDPFEPPDSKPATEV